MLGIWPNYFTDNMKNRFLSPINNNTFVPQIILRHRGGGDTAVFMPSRSLSTISFYSFQFLKDDHLCSSLRPDFDFHSIFIPNVWKALFKTLKFNSFSAIQLEAKTETNAIHHCLAGWYPTSTETIFKRRANENHFQSVYQDKEVASTS